MDEVLDQFVDDIANAFAATSADPEAAKKPLLIALAGAPGSGKSTLAKKAAAVLNNCGDDIAHGAGDVVSGSESEHHEIRAAIDEASLTADSPPEVLDVRMGKVFCFGMDGYHLYRHELDAMPNPEEAHRCRGAPWTFDPEKMLRDMTQLKETGLLDAPDFDHAKKDPDAGAIKIDARTTKGPEPGVLTRCVVIVEGLYLTLRDPPVWGKVGAAFDLVCFLNVPLEVSTERLIRRHMRAWGHSYELAAERARGSDYVNGQLVHASSVNAHVVLEGCDDEDFAKGGRDAYE